MPEYQTSLATAAPRSPRFWVTALLVAFLVAVPIYAQMAGKPFLLTFFSRILIFALAASGLNLVMGFGGLVSFGHALYIGLGAYVVGILSFHGVQSGLVHLIVTLLAAGLVAAFTGSISLRTKGVSFIMITLAFAQMFFFLAFSLRQYGGDDGLRIARRSALPFIDFARQDVLYWTLLICCLLVMGLIYRISHARLGMVLRGCKSNEARMVSMGFPTLRYKLFAYVLSAMICALAGFFLGNLTLFTSPAYLSWTLSGDLMVMSVLGGMSTVTGPVFGALAVLCLEELLKGWTEHWMAVLGLTILVIALFAKRGLYGALVFAKR